MMCLSMRGNVSASMPPSSLHKVLMVHNCWSINGFRVYVASSSENLKSPDAKLSPQLSSFAKVTSPENTLVNHYPHRSLKN